MGKPKLPPLVDLARALVFLHHHLNKDLKNEFMVDEDPPGSLECSHFKSVVVYSSTLHKIIIRLRLCGREIVETQLIEKTLSTFHTTNLVIAQQYGGKGYKTYVDLEFVLLVAEKHNELLMENQNACPTGT